MWWETVDLSYIDKNKTIYLTLSRSKGGVGGEFAGPTCFSHVFSIYHRNEQHSCDFSSFDMFFYLIKRKNMQTRLRWHPPLLPVLLEMCQQKCFLNILWHFGPNQSKIVGRNNKHVTHCFSFDWFRTIFETVTFGGLVTLTLNLYGFWCMDINYDGSIDGSVLRKR